MTRRHLQARQCGLTLIELMTAMVIGLVLMAGMMQIFVANKQSYQLSDGVSDMQESARYAVYLMSRDIRMAGYTGCISRDQKRGATQAERDKDLGVKVISLLTGMSAANANAYTPDNGVEGWEASGTGYGAFTAVANAGTSNAASGNNWSTAESVAINANTQVIANSDILRVWRVDGNPAFLTGSPGGTLQTGPGAEVAAGDILMVTDCYNADIVKACSVTNGTNATTISLSGCSGTRNSSTVLASETGAHVHRLKGWVYYVSKRAGGANSDTTNPPTLYRREIGQNGVAGAAQPLVNGVESLQLQYGEDTDTVDPDGVADRYVTADQVADWDNVVSVRMHLLMQSESNSVVDATGQTVAFNGTSITYNDGRLRYPFTATVALRNRSR